MKKSHLALWKVKKGILPNPEKGKEKLPLLDNNGPTPFPFTFNNLFSASQYENLLNYNS